MEQQAKITVVYGPNASGKTQYIETLRRQWASNRVRYLAFSDAYGAATDRAYYLQLRWNQHDIDEETPTVGNSITKAYQMTGEDTPERQLLREKLYQVFDMQALLDKYVILLSSGELRKFQLIKTLLANPAILILDNPFIGLDTQARQLLNDLLPQLAQSQQIHLYLVVARRNDIPEYATKIITIGPDGKPKDYKPDAKQARYEPEEKQTEATSDKRQIAVFPSALKSATTEKEVISMRNVSIRYGKRTILKDLNWQVMKGERWAVSGQNGSGKSTLLSLVCADNPQGYACDIALFGHPRGSGETIWQIKQRIGYVSPEMHRSYLRPIPAQQVVASGLKDTVGLYVRPNEEEKQRCLQWMKIFGIAHLAQRPFTTLSSGEQRLVLVARAFVKSPELLILDEPLHGLDDKNRDLVRNIIERYVEDKEKTLIMVTHYENELPTCVDKHLILRRN